MTILDDRAAWSGWALDPWTAHELAATLHRLQPRVVVETGSGASTVLLAEYAHRTGATVVSYEHHAVYAATTEQRLKQDGLSDHVDLRLAHLTDVPTPAGNKPWYAAPLPPHVDFALIDGPPGNVGRTAAFFALYSHLRDDWRVWLDDAHRPGENAALNLWGDRFPIYIRVAATPKGLAVIRPGVPDRSKVADLRPVDASDVAVTIITGKRPSLLASTLASIHDGAPGLLESAWVAVLHNGGDPVTGHLLDQFGSVIDHRATTDTVYPLGHAAHAMLGTAPPRPYTLHLEDDWTLTTTVHGWLDRARDMLRDSPRIGQVRLRHRGDKVLDKHMVTRRTINWQPASSACPMDTLVADAHYTLNPSLMRSTDLPVVWAVPDGEAQAAARYRNALWLSAQAVPGVFRHTGEGHSLRLGQVHG